MTKTLLLFDSSERRMSRDQESTCEVVITLCNMRPAASYPCAVCARKERCLSHLSSATCTYQFHLKRTYSVSAALRDVIENFTNNCSIIVNGADQSAYGLPHSPTLTKDLKSCAKESSLIGVLEHWPINNKPTHFTLTEEYQTGANRVI